MRRMLRASRGTFSISVAVCNGPALRDHLIDTFLAGDAAILRVPIPAEATNVLDVVEAASEGASPSAVMIVDLEKSLPSTADAHPVLLTLNASRERWRDVFACPVVLWLPEYATTLLSTHARDFWAWRSHQFDFFSEGATLSGGMADRFSGDLAWAGNLDADAKRFRIAELEQRIAEAGDSPANHLLPHVVVWLGELAFLKQGIGMLEAAERIQSKLLAIYTKLGRSEDLGSHYGNLGNIMWKRGDMDGAEAIYRKALAVHEKLGQLERAALDYGNLGNIMNTRDDLDGAEAMYRKALKIHEELGRIEGMASQYGNLGNILQTRGDLDGAEAMHRKALEIDEKLGRLEGIAIQYGNLGNVLQTRGNLDGAEAMYRKSLAINEKLGRLEGMANQYGNLGVVMQTRGDLDGAEAMHRKALEIDEKLGRLEGMAIQYANLGLLHKKRGGTDQARTLWEESRALYQRIGIPDMVKQIQGWIDDLATSDND